MNVSDPEKTAGPAEDLQPETEAPVEPETPMEKEVTPGAEVPVEGSVPLESGVGVDEGEPIEAGVPVDESEPIEAGVPMDESLPPPPETSPDFIEDTRLTAILEALVYVAEEPLTLKQISSALVQPAERIHALLEELVQEYEKPGHGIAIRELAGGYKMATKPEHHEAVRGFVKSLTPALKLSLPALETLAMIAYKQPITAPEVLEIRGVQGAGVIKTLLDRGIL